MMLQLIAILIKVNDQAALKQMSHGRNGRQRFETSSISAMHADMARNRRCAG